MLHKFINLVNCFDFIMDLSAKPKRHRYPGEIISYSVWSYHRFNDSYRDVSERLAYRGIIVSYENIRNWSNKFGKGYIQGIKNRECKPTVKWHMDEMNIRIGGDKYVLWRAVDSVGMELDIFVQKRKNKRAAIRFLTRLLGSYPAPRVATTDKLASYRKPIKQMMKTTEHRTHKRLNNHAENSHQPTRRKERCLIKFKSPQGLQNTLSPMGSVRNIFSVQLGRYQSPANERRCQFKLSKKIWEQVSQEVLYA